MGWEAMEWEAMEGVDDDDMMMIDTLSLHGDDMMM